MGDLSTYEEALKAWKLAGFKDGMIFSWIISEHKDICLELLQLILPDLEIVDVKNIKKEDTHKQNTVFHGARFDIYAADEHGRMYDIEMQVSDEHNLGKRISCYQSYLTQHALGAGQDYNDRVDTYVIFICDFDFFGASLPVYTTEVCVKESDLILDIGVVNCYQKHRKMCYNKPWKEVKMWVVIMTMLKPKEMAERLGVTVRTLQIWDSKGVLKAYRTPTNRRYYTEEQYLNYIGKSESNKRKVVAYARVSTIVKEMI